MDEMKIILMNGGLGNQIYQYTFMRYIELTTNSVCIVDDSAFWGNGIMHNGYELEKVFGIKLNLLSGLFSKDVWEEMLMKRDQGISIPQQLLDNGVNIFMIAEAKDYTFEGNCIYFEPFCIDKSALNAFSSVTGCVYYHGYWVNSIYWSIVKDVVKNELKFPDIESLIDMDAVNRGYADLIKATNSVGIHIRRGDFIECGRALSKGKYRCAVERFEEKYDDCIYFVFSNDIEWCRDNQEDLGLSTVKGDVVFVSENMVDARNYVDMQLMSMCKRLIISNSSFGTWAYYLNENEDVEVIVADYLKEHSKTRIMKSEPLITVYTQNFNKGAWVANCIESVLKQSYSNFEYLICDHGSTDNSWEIIKEWAQKDNRIKVFRRENSERGFIPELILQEGNGKYFVMLDSDDLMTNDNLEKLVAFAEENSLDIASCGAYAFDSTGSVSILRTAKRELLYSIEENASYFSEIYPFLRTIWGKIIRRDLLKVADFSVYKRNAQYYVAEDTAFVLALYEKCTRVGVLTDNLIYYRKNNNSVSENYNMNFVEGVEQAYYLAQKILRELNDTSDRSHEYIGKIFLLSIREAIHLLINSTLSISDKLYELEKICHNYLVRKLVVEQLVMIEFFSELMNWINGQTENLEMYTDDDMKSLEEVLNFLEIL